MAVRDPVIGPGDGPAEPGPLSLWLCHAGNPAAPRDGPRTGHHSRFRVRAQLDVTTATLGPGGPGLRPAASRDSASSERSVSPRPDCYAARRSPLRGKAGEPV
jgi:hypothetical protein